MLSLFLLLITISATYPAHVRWMPDKSFNLPMNFREQKLPCPKQTVVFPETVWESVIIGADVDISGIVLPKNGDLVIVKGGFEFGADSGTNCTEDGYAYYMPKSTSSWAQPDVWSSPKFNEATPDAERVPCYDDVAEFPVGTEFTVILPQDMQHIQGLMIHNKNYDTRTFNVAARYASAPSYAFGSQEFVLNDNGRTGIIVENKGCSSPVGCACQKNVLKIDCTLKFCPASKCLNPIQPVGHCCKICGGYLILEIDDQFDILAFEENVAEVINSYGKDKLVTHTGIITDKKLQLVVVDKGEYVGTSAQVVHEIESKIYSRGLFGEAQVSGGPLSFANMGGKIAVSMFFFVVLIISGIYLYYYKLPKTFDLRLPRMNRGTRGMMSRFERRTESVVSLTSRRGSMPVESSVGGTAFRNPLYSSKRGRVEVTESVVEE